MESFMYTAHKLDYLECAGLHKTTLSPLKSSFQESLNELNGKASDETSQWSLTPEHHEV